MTQFKKKECSTGVLLQKQTVLPTESYVVEYLCHVWNNGVCDPDKDYGTMGTLVCLIFMVSIFSASGLGYVQLTCIAILLNSLCIFQLYYTLK